MPIRILIVGAGFVGLPIARRLKRSLGTRVDVTLIDAKDHFLFAPRLIDALAGEVAEDQIKTDLSLIADRFDFHFIQGDVQSIDRTKKRMRYIAQGKLPNDADSISYDYLVLCPGSKISYFNIPGSKEYTSSLKSLEDVYHIHGRVHELVAQAREKKTDTQKAEIMNFVVVGGGASGVESLIALQQYVLRHCELHAPKLTPLVSFSLVNAAPQILTGFPLGSVRGAIKELTRRGVTLAMGEAVSCVENTCTVVTQSKRMSASLTIWASGVTPNIIPTEPDIHRDDRGSMITDAYLRVDPHTFAAGDAALYQEQNVIIPKNGQTALLMSRSISDNLIRSVKKQVLKPFHYKSKGSILWLGDTGFLNFGTFSLKSKFTPFLRELFYRYRQWQITKN